MTLYLFSRWRFCGEGPTAHLCRGDGSVLVRKSHPGAEAVPAEEAAANRSHQHFAHASTCSSFPLTAFAWNQRAGEGDGVQGGAPSLNTGLTCK